MDFNLLHFQNYKEYIDSYITTEDKRYLIDNKFRQIIVSLGYRSQGHICGPDEFEERRISAKKALNPKIIQRVLFGDSYKGTDPVLLAFKNRENLNATKVISTIVFLKVRNKSGFEISGYIDLERSFHNCSLMVKGAIDWPGIFQERIKLKPKRGNLSFYDIHSKVVSFNDTENYKTMYHPKHGLMFIYRGDRKIIPLGPNPNVNLKDNVEREMVYSDKYGFVVFYDHKIRRKA